MMDGLRAAEGWLRIQRAGLSALFLLLPGAAGAQQGGRDALSIFPADTQQFTYSNLAQLREVPDYEKFRQKLVTSQLQGFEDFLRSAGMDPDKDVDEVVLGWRGPTVDNASTYGLAEGRFQPAQIHKYFIENKLPIRQNAGQEIYDYRRGDERSGLFFAFLSSSRAIFGRLHDLQAMLDINSGRQPSLDSNGDFQNWETELEGNSPQWGIATGRAAANEVAPWLTASGARMTLDPADFLSAVHGVLYRVDWGSAFTTHISIICASDQSASAFADVMTLWQSAQPGNAPAMQPDLAAFIQGLQIEATGSRVELTGSGSAEAITRLLSGSFAAQSE